MARVLITGLWTTLDLHYKALHADLTFMEESIVEFNRANPKLVDELLEARRAVKDLVACLNHVYNDFNASERTDLQSLMSKIRYNPQHERFNQASM